MYLGLLNALVALAEGAAPSTPVAAPSQAAPGGLGSLLSGPLPIIIMIYAVFWFLWLGPKRKEQKKLEEWNKQVKKGDEVVTSGGLIGKITGMTDQTVTLEVQEKVRLKVLRSAITGKAPAPPGSQAAVADIQPAAK